LGTAATCDRGGGVRGTRGRGLIDGAGEASRREILEILGGQKRRRW